MTNKDAIKILQEQQAKFNDEYIDYGGVNEAYELAIKALELTESQRICCDNCVNCNIKSKEVCTSPFGECALFDTTAEMEGGEEKMRLICRVIGRSDKAWNG